MSQRINLQYSIDVEELESETHRLITKVTNTINQLSEIANSFCQNTSNNCLTLSAAEEVENIRRSIVTIDHQLSDISNIVKGYISFKTSTPEENTTQEVKEVVTETEPDELYGDDKIVSDIQKRIQEFKENQLKLDMSNLVNEQNTTKEHTKSE